MLIQPQSSLILWGDNAEPTPKKVTPLIHVLLIVVVNFVLANDMLILNKGAKR